MRRQLPNAISAFRGLLVLPIVYYTLDAVDRVPAVALALLAAAWASDGLDGWLARRWDADSELGRVLDPLSDKLVVCGTAVALWWGRGMPAWLAGVIVGRDVGILTLGIAMRRRLGSVPQSDRWGRVALNVLMLTLLVYLLGWKPASDVLRWVALAAVVVSALRYGLRFRREVRLKANGRAPIAQSG